MTLAQATMPAAIRETRLRRWRTMLLEVVLGIMFLLVNFPKFLLRTIDANVIDQGTRDALHAPIVAVQKVVSFMVGASPTDFFERVMAYDFVLLWTFIGLALLLALRCLDWRLIAYAIGGLVLGYAALHLIAWIATIIVTVIGGTLFVIRWVFEMAAAIVVFIFEYGWPVLVLAVVGVALYLLAKIPLIELLKSIASWLRRRWLWVLGAAVVAYLLYITVPIVVHWIKSFFHWIWEGIAWIVVPVVNFIVLVVVSIFAVVIGLGILAVLGHLLVVQIQAGWFAGNGRKGVALAGFAVGSAIALIMLVCVATPEVATSLNHAWSANLFVVGTGPGSPSDLSGIFLSTLPNSVATFVFTHLTNVHAPAIDAFVLLAIMGFANLSVALKLVAARPSSVEAMPVRLYPKEYFEIFGGLLIAVVVIFMQAEGGETTD